MDRIALTVFLDLGQVIFAGSMIAAGLPDSSIKKRNYTPDGCLRNSVKILKKLAWVQVTEQPLLG